MEKKYIEKDEGCNMISSYKKFISKNNNNYVLFNNLNIRLSHLMALLHLRSVFFTGYMNVCNRCERSYIQLTIIKMAKH